jgi:hypothetical protein
MRAAPAMHAGARRGSTDRSKGTTMKLPTHLVLLASGLIATSSSFAQAERGRGVDREEVRSEESVSVFTMTGDEGTVTLEIRNGRPVRLEIDGKGQPLERARRTPDGWEILGEDGEVIQRMAAPRGAAEARGFAWNPGKAQPPAQRGVERQATRRPGEPGRGPGADAPAPKSMIGAGLGGVDEALAKHLGVDRARTTMLTAVMDGLPAQAAGLERFDVVVAIDGKGDASPDALRRSLGGLEPGSKLKLSVRRGAETKEIEVEAASFDAKRLGEIEVEGFEIGPDAGLAMPGEGQGETRMFFFGPDGQRREMRVPPMPPMPPMQGMGDEGFDQMMREFERRMEAWGEGMERRMREGPAMRGGQSEQERVGASEDRLRRLEEQMERLMRELERANARERRGNDA